MKGLALTEIVEIIEYRLLDFSIAATQSKSLDPTKNTVTNTTKNTTPNH